MLRNGKSVCKACISDREFRIKEIKTRIRHIEISKKILGIFSFIIVLITIFTPLIFIEDTAWKLVFILGLMVFIWLTALIIEKFGFLLSKFPLFFSQITSIVPNKFSISKLYQEISPVQEEMRKIYAQYWELPPDWNWRRKQIIERDKGECQNCGSYIGKRNAHVHHKIPKAKTNGNHSPDNLTLLCADCHSKQPEPGHSFIKGE